MALTTIARGRVYDFSHAIGQVARSGPGFHVPSGLALSNDGVGYVLNRSDQADDGNPHVNRVCLGNTWEKEELLAEFGGPGQSDGLFVWPAGIALDMDGNVYVSDEWLNRISIFDQKGNFLGKWGKQGSGWGEFNGPSGLAFDAEDKLYVVDSLNHRIQRYSNDGVLLSQWGKLGSGPGEFNTPWGITLDHRGDVYVADWRNHRVQKLAPDGASLGQYGGPGPRPGSLYYPAGWRWTQTATCM